jgi:hypothetical protein
MRIHALQLVARQLELELTAAAPAHTNASLAKSR